ncbi:MAG: helix-turn-helix domain-containing protein [Candidatus Pseudobacter hemicellulosilyticus]|uniref:Helix-turn-helix domain-containing protein n=1 Tax=Candidatus Pseudobacter hemicellulosilyticus TaxID=3121375 RepID=A0AAJ5WXZ3_9BACT|nr:MAG: helix-turn-helix domain-containing protein [Pseudobacter sp.]
MKKIPPYVVDSIAVQHRLLSLPRPRHPMVSVFNFEDMLYSAEEAHSVLLMNLYCISLKRDVHEKVKYGQSHYDFDEGIMSFVAPGQLVSNVSEEHRPEGWCLAFHPDFIRNHPLGQKIKKYHFFTYEVNEALHLSEQEEETLIGLMKLMQAELGSSIDTFSEDVLIAYIELLLNYAERYYSRQFVTRRNLNKDVLSGFEKLLEAYFADDNPSQAGLPTVHYFSDKLHLSPNYLGSILKSLTGKSTQQHIQDALIERTKLLLANSELSVAEIAYKFGFGYPQSFNKLFRRKVRLSPLEYRKKFYI